MYGKSLGAFLIYTFIFALIIVLGVIGMRWAHIDSGQLMDWIAGMLFFWWMLVITTVPWNVYFEARSVLEEFNLSQSAGIAIDEKQRQYVTKIAFWGIWLAIGLHLVTAAGMYALSASGISHIGYVACAVALLLTLLRPSIRAYEFIWQQLRSIKESVKYPREDVSSLRRTINKLEGIVQQIQDSLESKNPGSFAHAMKHDLADLKFKYERLVGEQARLSDENVWEHERISREGQEAIAKISADTQFLDHVREIVRLIKSA